MALGRPIPPLQLSREERETLERWVRRPKSAQALALRARVILACAQGKTNTAVAQQMHLAKPTVGKWRSRFVARRLDGLLDATPPRCAAGNQRRRRRARTHLDAGNAPARRHALVHAFDGPALRVEPERGQPHLARFCPATASGRNVSALQGPAVY